jgi:hypothetical protein
MNLDGADEKRFHYDGRAEVLRWHVKTCTMMISGIHYLRIRNASLYRKYAMSIVGRE